MTSTAVAAALGRILEANSVPALNEIAAELRRMHPGDPEAETVARTVEIKRRRIIQES